MWTVTLDSNVPIVTKAEKHSIHGSGRASIDALTTSRNKDEEVEELLNTSSPMRSRSSSLSRRPPHSRSARHPSYRSRSEAASRPTSPSSEHHSHRKRWQEENENDTFESALENSVSFVD